MTCSRRRWRWTVLILHRNFFALHALEEMRPMCMKYYGWVREDYCVSYVFSKNIILFITAWKSLLPHIRRLHASNRKVTCHHIFHIENSMLHKTVLIRFSAWSKMLCWRYFIVWGEKCWIISLLYKAKEEVPHGRIFFSASA